jgi:hypothetical protein
MTRPEDRKGSDKVLEVETIVVAAGGEQTGHDQVAHGIKYDLVKKKFYLRK